MLTIYKSQIRPSLEYCSLSGVVLLNLLPNFSTKSNLTLSVSSTVQTSPFLLPFSHCRLVSDLSIFNRYVHGNCSLEIKNIIPCPARHVRTTRSSTHSHPFQATLPNPRTLTHKSSFISRTSQLWNSLQSPIFPES